MSLFHILIVALIQGITEFLPISSTAHLALLDDVLDIPYQGVMVDVAAHVGTLLAVMLYFRKDIKAVLVGLLFTLAGRSEYEQARLFRHLTIATLPLIPFGAFLYWLGALDALREPYVIAWTTLIYAVALYIADRWGRTDLSLRDMGWRGALLVGVTQAFALIPGTSRSGVTMTTGRFLGLSRPEAARFAMLLSIPAILATGGAAGYELYRLGDMRITQDALIVAALSCIAALIAIKLFMGWINRASMTPFVLYRLVMAGALFWLAYG